MRKTARTIYSISENALALVVADERGAQLKIQSLEERWRQHLIKLYGPKSETLSNLQLDLLEEEPSVTRDEVEAESRHEPLPSQPPRERKPHPGRKPCRRTAARDGLPVVRAPVSQCASVDRGPP